MADIRSVQVADFLPKAMERFPDQEESLFVRDERKTDLERVNLLDLDEMKRQVLKDLGLTSDQAAVTLESFDSEGKPVFTARLIGILLPS